MTVDTECIHGMNPDWCTICKRGPTVAQAEEVDRVFQARFEGQCHECDLGIFVGQSVAKLTTGRYVHTWCAP